MDNRIPQFVFLLNGLVLMRCIGKTRAAFSGNIKVCAPTSYIKRTICNRPMQAASNNFCESGG